MKFKNVGEQLEFLAERVAKAEKNYPNSRIQQCDYLHETVKDAGLAPSPIQIDNQGGMGFWMKDGSR